MRIFLLLTAAVVLGAALGTGLAYWDVRAAKPAPEGESGPLPPEAAAAKVAVDSQEYDFGTIDADKEASHSFLFTNIGTAPLELSQGMITCRCTVSLVDAAPVPPGGSTKVKVTWRPKGGLGPYRRTVSIRTNDPLRPDITLTVAGEVTVALRADPPELVFSSVGLGAAASGEVRLWCRLAGRPLAITGYRLSDPATAQFFQVAWEALPAAELRQQKGATSGLRLRVGVKPGLPQGAFQQTISLETNQPSHPELTVPVKGVIESDISVAGPNWSSQSGLLDIGTVSRQMGTQRRLLLVVRGANCGSVRFKPVRRVPEFLDVRVGEVKVIGDGEAAHTALFIQIPRDCPPVSYLGPDHGKLGEILLETNHPRVPQVRILVRFAVEG
jgi:hypothetical protein